MAKRTTCTSHCAACGRHFAGDTAFDMHRRGDPATGRHCVSPLDEPRLTTAADDGYCAISGEHDDGVPLVLDPITVYGLAASRTPAERARLAALRTGVCGDRSSACEGAIGEDVRVPVLALVEAL